MTASFSDFALAPAVLRGVEALGFTSPTPVQEAAIPLLMAHRDAIVMAKTGSGKTLAFGLPLLTMLQRGKRPQALVVVPTRELAQQIREALTQAGQFAPARTVVIYGGVGLGPQEKSLAAGCDIVVGTPGRLKDLLGRGSLDLGNVHVLVLDEADEMLDKGFRRDIEFLLDRMPARQQTLIFSATMPPEIEVIARRHLKDPAVVKLTQQQAVPTEITHFFHRVAADMRLDALVALIRSEAPERALVFTRTKRETKILAKKLETYAGIEAGFLNGNMSQNARDTMLARFRAGEFRILVATDVAARGLDVEGLTHVFHFAVPTVVETYIHRSGRTGRAGNDGKTIILVTPDDAAEFKAISKRVRIDELVLDVPRLERPEGAAPVQRGPRTQRSLDPSLDDGRDAGPPQRQVRGQRAPRPAGEQAAPRPARAPRDDRGVRDAAQGERGTRREAPVGDRSAPRPPREPRAPREDGRAPRPAKPEGGGAPWRTFKLKLRPGHEHSPESFRSWLSQQTRTAAVHVRAVKVHPDHATFEVDTLVVDRFLARLQRQGG